jgi:hypothetical protein
MVSHEIIFKAAKRFVVSLAGLACALTLSACDDNTSAAVHNKQMFISGYNCVVDGSLGYTADQIARICNGDTAATENAQTTPVDGKTICGAMVIGIGNIRRVIGNIGSVVNTTPNGISYTYDNNPSHKLTIANPNDSSQIIAQWDSVKISTDPSTGTAISMNGIAETSTGQTYNLTITGNGTGQCTTPNQVITIG